MDKSSEEMTTQDDTKAYVMSLIQEVFDIGILLLNQSTLLSILKRASNPQTRLGPGVADSLESLLP
jgi:hypothetical protein